MPREPTFATDSFSLGQVAAYLRRIALSPSLVDSPPSFQLLSQLYLAHHENVPKDTTAMHCSHDAWIGPSSPIVLGSSFTQMALRTDAFDPIVRRHAGSYCWGNNPTFAALLRSFKFRVSEVAAKVFKGWANLDPADEVARDKWGTFTHIVLLVDWNGSGQRYVLDVGFGGDGCPIPVPLQDGATVSGLNPYECWTLKHEPLPYEPEDEPPIDILPGYTLYRRTVLPESPIGTKLPSGSELTSSTPTTWTHQFHFLLSSITIRDIGLFNFYSQYHPLAAFTGFFLVTKLIPGTGGARRSLMFSEKMAKGGPRLARVHTTGGEAAQGRKLVRDVEYVPMETGPMREYLEKEFGFVFEYKG